MAKRKPPKPCERCPELAISGQRFCKDCKKAVLAELKEAGYIVGICTNKPFALAESLLTKLGVRGDFAALLGADSLAVRKPDPEHLFETVRRAGGHPEKCVLVGDTATDRDTSKAAGVPSILVTFGPSGDDMAALEPEGFINDYSELLGEVQRLIGAA